MDKILIHLLDKAGKKYESGVQEKWTPDAVHDYRVAIRKTRTYLKFWCADSKGRHKWLKTKLVFLQRQTALVREWDVFMEGFGDVLDEKAIGKGKFARLLLVEGFHSAKASWNEIEQVGPKIKGEPESQREEKLLKQIFQESQVAYVNWHRLRIRVKGYRYTLEQKLEVDKKTVEVLKEWQDLLGLIQDGYTNRKWFDCLGEQDTIVRHANEERLNENLKEAKNKLPGFIEFLQRQHP